MTNRTYRPWSHVEDAIIHAHLTDGRTAIQRELRLAGYDRSLDQIKGRIRLLRSKTGTEQLKPCPFCGSKAAIHTQRSESLWSHDIVTWTRVECSNEDCAITTESRCEGWEPTPIESWNRRTPTGATHDN